jgi:hypothetical protein
MHAFIFLALLATPAAASAQESTLLDLGYRQMYNLEFERAHQSFAEWERSHPGDPLGSVSNAAALLYAEFDRLHILQAELFVDDNKFKKIRREKPDPALKQKFENELVRSSQLADRVLARSPKDANALFATTLRMGLRADYFALIEKRYLASLKEVKTGRAVSEKLLAISPKYYDAYLAIGVENYMLSLKPAPLRWLLRIGGAQTDKNEGIRNLRLTAERGRYLLPYARLLLAVAALRDQDRRRARELLEGLAREFPKNPLYAYELGRIGGATGN